VSLLGFAREAEVSQFQLLRDFKRRYGSTPHAYGLHVRVERARSLLRSGASVADAAAAADFVDQSHFTRYFRRVWTLTPGQYARGERSAPRFRESRRH
jgi:AraC-like DNA-binding protein